jgi:hypothetical protein
MSDPLRQATGEEECKKPSESRDNPTRWTWTAAWYSAASGNQHWDFTDSSNFNFPYLFIRQTRACVSIFIYVYCFARILIVVQLTKASEPKRPDVNCMCYVYCSWNFMWT